MKKLYSYKNESDLEFATPEFEYTIGTVSKRDHTDAHGSSVTLSQEEKHEASVEMSVSAKPPFCEISAKAGYSYTNTKGETHQSTSESSSMVSLEGNTSMKVTFLSQKIPPHNEVCVYQFQVNLTGDIFQQFNDLIITGGPIFDPKLIISSNPGYFMHKIVINSAKSLDHMWYSFDYSNNILAVGLNKVLDITRDTAIYSFNRLNYNGLEVCTIQYRQWILSRVDGDNILSMVFFDKTNFDHTPNKNNLWIIAPQSANTFYILDAHSDNYKKGITIPSSLPINLFPLLEPTHAPLYTSDTPSLFSWKIAD